MMYKSVSSSVFQGTWLLALCAEPTSDCLRNTKRRDLSKAAPRYFRLLSLRKSLFCHFPIDPAPNFGFVGKDQIRLRHLQME